MVETDRHTDLCSEHALTPGFSFGLVAVQTPDLGRRRGGQMVDTPSHRSIEVPPETPGANPEGLSLAATKAASTKAACS